MCNVSFNCISGLVNHSRKRETRFARKGSSQDLERKVEIVKENRAKTGIARNEGFMTVGIGIAIGITSETGYDHERERERERSRSYDSRSRRRSCSRSLDQSRDYDRELMI